MGIRAQTPALPALDNGQEPAGGQISPTLSPASGPNDFEQFHAGGCSQADCLAALVRREIAISSANLMDLRHTVHQSLNARPNGVAVRFHSVQLDRQRVSSRFSLIAQQGDGSIKMSHDQVRLAVAIEIDTSSSTPQVLVQEIRPACF
jgi:hypothetical protein